jgi:putative flippase GtrA
VTSLRSRLHRRNWILLARFAAVGASGVLVNLLVVILVNQFGPDAEADVVSLRPTDFHVRWYHAYSTVAFFVANLWNFQLNRQWTFRSSGAAGWWREYVPFLTVGLLTQGGGPAAADPADAPGITLGPTPRSVRRFLDLADASVLGSVDRDRADHAAVVRTQQDLDVRGRTRVALSPPATT